MNKTQVKKPIFNVHTHVFTDKHVPPFLAKTIVVWPFYYLIHLGFFVRCYKSYMWFNNRKFRSRVLRRTAFFSHLKQSLKQSAFGRLMYNLVLCWIVITTFYIFFYFLVPVSSDNTSYAGVTNFFVQIGHWLTDRYILFKRPDWLPRGLNLFFAFGLFIMVKSARKVILFAVDQVRSFLHLLPGKSTKALFLRYLEMARYATYQQQYSIFARLSRQYPVNTHFGVLPMDMEFMDAGKVNSKYNFYEQMEGLIRLNKKKEVHAFIFIDPRRIRKDGKKFLDFEMGDNSQILLKESFVKRFIEDENFAGIKIYPALGYFPFDEDLLPLWKYAADHGIPIMTHGIKGVIYYRGIIQTEWLKHPVFKMNIGKGKMAPLQFTNVRNADFQSNFTHPMNYLCLLEEPLLRKLIGEGKSQLNKELFGFTNMDTPLKHNLNQLKICFAHFGGEDEWRRYLNRDRDNYAQQLMAKPATGIQLGTNANNVIPWGRYENVWRYTDWYSIVCSMMIQYPNFYSDISYIVSDTSLYPLLKSTISSAEKFENQFLNQLTYESRNKLRSRVLFGSDFYVVRSQKSDKDIFTEISAFLSEEEFDLIARDNPANYMRKKNENT